MNLLSNPFVCRAIAGLLVALVSSALLTGCPTAPKQPDTGPTAAELDAMDGRGTRTAGLEDRSRSPLDDPSSPLYQRVIYFEYDSFAVDPKYANLLRAHADYVAKTPGVALVLEGHTDERGTREYNLALGDRRADSVRRFLMTEGAPGDRIRTLSYGEERPAEIGGGERAYSLSRRVELVY